MHEPSDSGIPVLTDVVGERDDAAQYPSNVEMLVAELQTRLAAETFALTEELLRGAIAEIEAALFEQVSRRLREALPELIDSILREHLTTDADMED